MTTAQTIAEENAQACDRAADALLKLANLFQDVGDALFIHADPRTVRPYLTLFDRLAKEADALAAQIRERGAYYAAGLLPPTV